MKDTICVVGLGYVGLPLAIAFGKTDLPTIGFDINTTRIEELRRHHDRNNEHTQEELQQTRVDYTADPTRIKEATIIIIAVPTPVNEETFEPDLIFLEKSSELVGKNLTKGSIVVFESTVYPGVTEDFCLPIISKHSGLSYPQDFKAGYSPERINPGDKEHALERVIKIVSGCDPPTTRKLAEIYGKVAKAGVYQAPSIQVAEAAKVIENIQRDLNIALMNELSLIFEKLGLNTHEVIAAASTKWNFHKYHPGLVGGHCIGVDPYYLTHRAKQLGYDPKVILAGRATNNYMAVHVAKLALDALKNQGKNPQNSHILVMGLTFKENVKDARNSQAREVIHTLKTAGAHVLGWDPLLEDADVQKAFGLPNTPLHLSGKLDAIILVTPHKTLTTLTLEELRQHMDQPILIDVRGVFNRHHAKQQGFTYRSL